VRAAGSAGRRSDKEFRPASMDDHARGTGGVSVPKLLLISAERELEIGWDWLEAFGAAAGRSGAAGVKEKYVGECDSTTGSGAGVNELNVVRGLSA
jgi:hypothetical protein